MIDTPLIYILVFLSQFQSAGNAGKSTLFVDLVGPSITRHFWAVGPSSRVGTEAHSSAQFLLSTSTPFAQ